MQEGKKDSDFRNEAVQVYGLTDGEVKDLCAKIIVPPIRIFAISAFAGALAAAVCVCFSGLKLLLVALEKIF